MERLRATGVDAENSLPDRSTDDDAWRVLVELTRPLTDDERAVFDATWRVFIEDDSEPFLNLPKRSSIGDQVQLRLEEPEELAEVIPKLQTFLQRVESMAVARERQREADRKRVREAAAAVNWWG